MLIACARGKKLVELLTYETKADLFCYGQLNRRRTLCRQSMRFFAASVTWSVKTESDMCWLKDKVVGAADEEAEEEVGATDIEEWICGERGGWGALEWHESLPLGYTRCSDASFPAP